jgi:TRAP-type C4-dicarboxylate transport system substrate-binding protein
MATSASLAGIGAGAQAVELSVAHFAAPTHPVAQWIVKWTKEMEEKSNKRLTFNIIPNSQLGPIDRYYDIARRGQADITWFLHGGSPGRFALTELSNLPFMFCSGEHATKVLNDPGLRQKYLDKEHEGVKVLQLHAHVPGQIWMANKPINTVADFRGTAIRPASRTIGAFVSALGAKPVGLPPTALAENMQKGTIDGTFMDYVAGAFAFKLGPVTKHITDMYSYTASLGFIMNQGAWDKLPSDLQKVIHDSIQGREKDVGGSWDAVDGRAKNVLTSGGTKIIKMSSEEFKKLKDVGDQVTKKWVAELDAKGLPGTAALADMKALAAKTKASSVNFCQD